MDSKVSLVLNDVETLVEVTQKAIKTDTEKINYKDIKSLHTKNDEFYRLRIVTTLSTYVMRFNTMHMRDLFKKIILYCKSPGSDDMLEVFIRYPLLIKIFEELGVSQAQFLNYYKSSFFYSIRNEKNCIDRLLGKKMGFPCDNFASRINNVSLLDMQSQRTIDVKPKGFIEKEVDFEPVYLETDVSERKRQNSFDFKDFDGIKFDIDVEVGSQRSREVFDKADLEMLRTLKRDGATIREDAFEKLGTKYGQENLKLLKRIMPRAESPAIGVQPL